MKKSETPTAKSKQKSVSITAPDMCTALFTIEGTAPLVIHRFDEKVKKEFLDKIISGTTPKGKKKHEPRDPVDICQAAKYIGQTKGEKWEGFNASAIRCAMISACRLVGFKMTIAKMSIFVIADGWDIINPVYPLVRIYGEPERLDLIGRTETGVAMLVIRPMYREWTAKLKIRFDRGQFSLTDVSNLLMRVGEQVGIGEGRPDSKNSAGMGWGTFKIANQNVA